MPGNAEIKAEIRLGGEKEFKQGVTDINKSLTAMKSELNLVTERYKGQSNSLEALSAKQEVLNRILEEQKRKTEAVKAGLANANAVYEKAGQKVEELRTKLDVIRHFLITGDNAVTSN